MPPSSVEARQFISVLSLRQAAGPRYSLHCLIVQVSPVIQKSQAADGEPLLTARHRLSGQPFDHRKDHMRVHPGLLDLACDYDDDVCRRFVILTIALRDQNRTYPKLFTPDNIRLSSQIRKVYVSPPYSEAGRLHMGTLFLPSRHRLSASSLSL